ncbi:unnamed protein product, partial [Peniophora sp. CBMAI 1063]
PLSVAEWTKEFLPSRETPIKLDPDALPDSHDALAFEDYITRSGVCATVFPRATLGVHGKDHTTNTFLSADFSILSKNFVFDHDSRVVRDELLGCTLAFGDIVPEKYDPCPFADGKPDTEDAAYTRGRLGAIMRAVAVNSHRTFCFAFVVMPEFARLLRFDHAGIVYTELFPWRTSGDLLHFLKAFDCMSPAQRGCDTSVSAIAADSEEAVQAKEILAGSDALPDDVPKTSVIPSGHDGMLFLINVYDDEQQTYHRVVVHRPIHSVEFYVGRSMLGFYGVDLDEKIVVYVKDAWRIASPTAAPEAATYRRLNGHHVPYLPGFYFGGDVPEESAAPHASSGSPATPVHSSCSERFLKDREARLLRSPGINNGLHAHVHHRLLFKKIGRPLKSFGSTLQLCTSLMHGLQSHGAAYEIARILHRDISGGNILIDKNGDGMLIDWDMCVWLENKEEVEKVDQKIGTWAFISAALLTSHETRPHLLRDDLESFVHILFYHVFRYRPTAPAGSSKQKQIYASMKRVFDTAFYTGGDMRGGHDKACYLYDALHFESSLLRECVRPEPLRRLMTTARNVFSPLYVPKPYVEEEDEDLSDELEKLEDWQKEHDKALGRLETPEYFISVFRKWTQEYDRQRYQWASGDGAVDQYHRPDPDPITPSHSGHSHKRSIDAVEDEPQPAVKARRGASHTSAGQSSRASVRLR